MVIPERPKLRPVSQQLLDEMLSLCGADEKEWTA
jgi:hypothetical protein